jgi:ribosomal protein L32
MKSQNKSKETGEYSLSHRVGKYFLRRKVIEEISTGKV